MTQHRAFEQEAEQLLERCLEELRGLSYVDVAAMPEAAEEEVVLAGCKCSVTVYVQPIGYNLILLTASVTRSTLLGVAHVARERGLVFGKDLMVRDATAAELIDSGG
jgi:hypothetical protein